MNKGFCLLAQNNNETNYVRQAYALALSLHKYNKDQKISLITNDQVPQEWQKSFDQIIPIPWTDSAAESEWKIENRWKLYHASPYDETIVLEADMLITSDITHWWEELKKRDIFFVSNVRTYRDEIITNRFYRKTFMLMNFLIYTVHYTTLRKAIEQKNFIIYLKLLLITGSYFTESMQLKNIKNGAALICVQQ